MSVATKLAEERRRRHSASVGSRYGNGRSAGHDVCCAGEGDCACDRSNSEQGRGAERWARGRPRERAGWVEQSEVVTAEGGSGQSVTRLGRAGCRGGGVARRPLAVVGLGGRLRTRRRRLPGTERGASGI